MEDLNENISCFIEELVDIKRDKDLSIEDKITKLNEIGSQLENLLYFSFKII